MSPKMVALLTETSRIMYSTVRRCGSSLGHFQCVIVGMSIRRAGRIWACPDGLIFWAFLVKAQIGPCPNETIAK